MKKLFWIDPYLTKLETSVAAINVNEIIFNETIAYSESGGQEGDKATIATCKEFILRWTMNRSVVLLLLAATFLPLLPLCADDSISVVIIGGGPTGLATAIEAKAAGANVIVVEKREQYAREQYVFLMEPALNLLDKWKVSIPELMMGDESGEKVGAMKIKELENGLARRIHELEIPIFFGEFQGLQDGKVVISQQNQKLELSYDLLVGADGTHSAVRDLLNISSTLYGSAIGSIAVIPFPSENENMEFVLPFKCGIPFFTKIIIPSATLISAQAKKLSHEMVISAAIQCGWLEEASLISSHTGQYFDNIEIVLQQSDTFSDATHSVILLGDAAASASFLLGTGANCALESATIAGLFFQTKQNNSDYVDFNRSMQKITDRLIDESRFIFNDIEQ